MKGRCYSGAGCFYLDIRIKNGVIFLDFAWNFCILLLVPTLIRNEKVFKAAEVSREIEDLQERLTSLIGANSRTNALPKLHDQTTGRIDARGVAEFLGVALKPLCEGLGLKYKAVHKDPTGETFQEALQPVERVLDYLCKLFQTKEIIRAWLKTPHPMLEGKSSLEIILEGKAFAVERLLGNAWDGVVS